MPKSKFAPKRKVISAEKKAVKLAAIQREEIYSLPIVPSLVIPMTVRFTVVSATVNTTVNGLALAKLLNIVTKITSSVLIDVQPIISNMKITKITLCSTASASGTTPSNSLVWGSASLSGFSSAPPTFQLSGSPGTTSFHKQVYKPPSSSLYKEWFDPLLANTATIFGVNINTSQNCYLDLSFVFTFNNKQSFIYSPPPVGPTAGVATVSASGNTVGCLLVNSQSLGGFIPIGYPTVAY